VRGVERDEKQHVRLALAFDKIDGLCDDLVVDGLHALFALRSGVKDRLSAVRIGFALEDSARPKFFLKVRVVGGGAMARLFHRVQMVEQAEELVEAMRCREKFVLIAAVILPNRPMT
jgi:hypothetical protein